MNPKLKEAIEKVYNKFMAMPTEELLKELKEHEAGDIAAIFLKIRKDEEMIRMQEAQEILKPGWEIISGGKKILPGEENLFSLSFFIKNFHFLQLTPLLTKKTTLQNASSTTNGQRAS